LTSSQPSAAPAAVTDTSPAVTDKPTKNDKKAIEETATAVAKDPSVGGIQSLFEQAGFSDALLQLGLGMMASKNPDFLGALGESGQSAVALMAKQREAAKKAKDDADKLALDTRNVAANELNAKTNSLRDQDPAALQNAKLVASSITTALAQAKAGVTGTPEQIIARQHIAGTAIPAAERAAAARAKEWQTGFNKIQDIPSTTQKQAALAEFYRMNGRDADEAENKAYQDSIKRSDPQGILQIGLPPAQNKVYDPVSKTLK
jgi:peptidoglycan hydrolase-like protein with peptidoglycan-binding domain